MKCQYMADVISFVHRVCKLAIPVCVLAVVINVPKFLETELTWVSERDIRKLYFRGQCVWEGLTSTFSAQDNLVFNFPNEKNNFDG